MNIDALKSEISQVLVGLPNQLLNPSASISDVSMYYLQTKPEDIVGLVRILREDSVVCEHFDDTMFNTGNGASSVYLESLAMWLIGVARLEGVDTTIGYLESFVSSSSTTCWNVLAISGISVTEEVLIGNGMKLIPFENLPQSYGKDAISPPYLKPEFLLRLGHIPHQTNNGYRPPSVALVQEAGISPKTFSREDMSFRGQDFQGLYEFCEFLTLVKSATPVSVGAWVDLPESTPCKQLLGGGWSSPVIDVLSRSETSISQQDWNQVSELYKKFVDLPQEIRDLLRVPIERINQARRRSNLADRAIDLGVACEALLLNDKTHKEQISFTLRLRAALFLGSDFEDRQKLLNFFSAFYSCRSQAAHTGKLDTKIKVSYRGRLDANTILSEGDEHLTHAIKNIIKLGRFPDWNELMLKKEFA
ncbi:hypothetical protein SNE95_003392 [Vibrio cholerae]|uniref:HEPN domain-containing protein n=1 Tax=Vibrio paracholerae TaxID=650003 RepID=UPI000DE2684B|nr:HEPN domain-containing protein [Vibrio paracholerae]ELJ8549534.1 hypothetical protein [Vibrio cholerae]ELY5189435.1 hypothetical protein [Vibrio cholerae]ELY5289342.1 hypothetical protein [Vibrio cholerae]RBM74028.1 hypothetical protein DLR68_15270 [Vibrio paracholerae]